MALLSAIAESSPAVSCGLGQETQPVSVFVLDPVSGYLVGGGLLRTRSERVVIERRDGSEVDAVATELAFLLTADQRVAPVDFAGVRAQP